MIYLDNAATSFPKPDAVAAAVEDVLKRAGGNPGRGSHRMSVEAGRVVLRARQAAARLIGVADSSRIVFTKNATEAVNAALKGILKPGDRAITTTFEHNSVVKTLAALERAGVVVERLRPDAKGFIDPRAVGQAIDPRTRVVCLAHASNVYGSLQDVGAIGRECGKRGVLFMVDAAQTLGAAEFDAPAFNADIVAATGHKSLLGPQGTGFLYLAPGVEPPPFVDGGTGEEDAMLELPDRLETGTLNTPGIAGLGAGIGVVAAEGVGAIRAREAALVGAIIEGLKAIEGVRIIGTDDPFKRASLVAFTMRGVLPAEAGAAFDERFSIMLRCGAMCAPYAHMEAGTYPLGAIRVSPGFFTTAGDVDEFLRAARAIASGTRA